MKCYATMVHPGFREDKLGQLKTNMLAYFIVLEKNIFELDSIEVKNVEVISTLLEEKICL